MVLAVLLGVLLGVLPAVPLGAPVVVAVVVGVVLLVVLVVAVVQVVDRGNSNPAVCSILPRLGCNLAGLPDLVLLVLQPLQLVAGKTVDNKLPMLQNNLFGLELGPAVGLAVGLVAEEAVAAHTAVVAGHIAGVAAVEAVDYTAVVAVHTDHIVTTLPVAVVVVVVAAVVVGSSRVGSSFVLG